MTKTPLIAIVDDDAAVRNSLTSLIRSLGYHVTEFASGREFLESAGSKLPDALISDLQMPVMTGLELQVEIASRGYRLPVVFMTGFPSEETRRKAMQDGALAYVTKPAAGEEIAQCLSSHFSESDLADLA